MSLPKVELHLHLEGAAPPDLIRRIADEKRQRLDGVFAADGSYAFEGFGHFLQVYEAATAVLGTPEDYARLTEAVAERQAEAGVVYTEFFVAPQFCGGGEVAAWKDYLAAISEAASRAEARHGIVLRGIAVAIRHFGPEASRRASLCAAETAGGLLVGFGLAGDERRGSAGDFAYAFDMAREARLCTTAHAGEWAGPASVRDALDVLRVDRVGHGVRAIEEPALVDRLARDGVVLEVCPGSNVALGLYPSWRAHPIDRLRAAGVPVTVSTDDPPFFHTSLGAEYDRLAETFGWQDDTFRAINRTAADAAFCGADTRARVRKMLEPDDD